MSPLQRHWARLFGAGIVSAFLGGTAAAVSASGSPVRVDVDPGTAWYGFFNYQVTATQAGGFGVAWEEDTKEDQPFFPAIEGMSGCRQYCVGFANYDTRELGTSAAERPGYEVISKWRDLPYDPILGLGVNDIHTDFVEPPELVRDRILYAVDVFGDPARIHVCPDCGLRTRSWDVAYEKLRAMVEGTRLAEEALNRAHASA